MIIYWHLTNIAVILRQNSDLTQKHIGTLNSPVSVIFNSPCHLSLNNTRDALEKIKHVLVLLPTPADSHRLKPKIAVRCSGSRIHSLIWADWHMHWVSRDLLLVWQYERAHNQRWLLSPPRTVCTCTAAAAATSKQARKTVLFSNTLIKCCAESAVDSLGRVEGQSGWAGGHWEIQIMAPMEHRDGGGTQSGGSGRQCIPS